MSYDQFMRILIMGAAFPLIKMFADSLKKQPWAEIDNKYVNPIYWIKRLRKKRRDID